MSATFVVGIIGVNDRVGIVRAVGADGNPVIDGNVGRPVIVGKRGTDVKKEYAADVMLDVIVDGVVAEVTGGDIVIVVAPVPGGEAEAGAVRAARVAEAVDAEGTEFNTDAAGKAEAIVPERRPVPSFCPNGFNESVTPGIIVIKSILLSSRIY